MLKTGDIIEINKIKLNNGLTIGKHRYVVTDTTAGEIQGMSWDYIISMLSSYKEDRKKLNYKKHGIPLNVDIPIQDGLPREGFLKAEQFIYFQEDNIEYTYIDTLQQDTLDTVMNCIEELVENDCILHEVGNLSR